MTASPNNNSDEGWIEWSGGECPVAPGTWVRVRCRSGYESRNPLRAGAKHLQKFWRHDPPKLPAPAWRKDEADIIAYRVVKPEPGK